MNGDMLLDATLKGVCENVRRVFFRKPKNAALPNTFITHAILRSEGAGHGDDSPRARLTEFSISIFSKSDYAELLQNVLTAIRAAGFHGTVIEAELYEKDTGFFHVPITTKYLETED